MDVVDKLNHHFIEEVRALEDIWTQYFADYVPQDQTAVDFQKRISELREDIQELILEYRQKRSYNWYERMLYKIIPEPSLSVEEQKEIEDQSERIQTLHGRMVRASHQRGGPLSDIAFGKDFTSALKSTQGPRPLNDFLDVPSVVHAAVVLREGKVEDSSFVGVQNIETVPSRKLREWLNDDQKQLAGLDEDGYQTIELVEDYGDDEVEALVAACDLSSDLRKLAHKLVLIMDRTAEVQDTYLNMELVKGLARAARDLLILYTQRLLSNDTDADAIRFFVQRTIPVIFAISRFLDAVKSPAKGYVYGAVATNLRRLSEAKILRATISDLHNCCLNNDLSELNVSSKKPKTPNTPITLPELNPAALSKLSDDVFDVLNAKSWGDNATLEEIAFNLKVETNEWITRKLHNDMQEDLCLTAADFTFNQKLDYVIRVIDKLEIPLLQVSVADFDTSQILGKGALASVYKATDFKGKKTYAVKTFDREDMTEEDRLKCIVQEARIWAKVRNQEHICHLFGYMLWNSTPALISEYCINGNLTVYISRHKLTTVEKLRLAKDVVQGLETLHTLKIFHGDVRADNMLVNDNGQAMIADFGMAYTQHERPTGDAVVTNENWLAPELFTSGKKTPFKDRKLSERTDMYSYGWLCYEVLAQKQPQKQLKIEVDAGLAQSARDSIDIRCWNFMLKLWNSVPEKRPYAFLANRYLNELLKEFDAV